VATIAFFLAVGGVGYAVTGSGTFQKENEIGIVQAPSVETVRTIAGTGQINARCEDGQVFVQFKNASGEELQARVDTGDTQIVDDSIPNNFSLDQEATALADEIYQFHVFPADGSKTPQADITVSASFTGSCSNAQVAVLNVTTTSSGSGTVAGSGTLQKGSLEGIPSIPPDDYALVRAVTGVGTIKAACVSGNPNLRVQNTSGETLRIFIDRLDAFDTVELNNNGARIDAASQDTVFKYHVFPADGSKRPQADIVVSVDHTGSCATSQVSVLNVTTEQ
jgi:hypothetical protein